MMAVSDDHDSAQRTLSDQKDDQVGSRLEAYNPRHQVDGSPVDPQLPAGRRQTDEGKAVLSTSRAAAPVPQQPLEILSVDDDRMHQRTVAKLLSKHGWRCLSAFSAEECLEILDGRYNQAGSSFATFPTMILMDIHLPGCNGFSVVKEIRNRYPDASLPIVMVTASTEDNCISDSLKAGANDFISKPFSASNLLLQARIGERQQYLKYWNAHVAFQASSAAPAADTA